MKKNTIIAMFCAALFLSGCNEESFNQVQEKSEMVNLSNTQKTLKSFYEQKNKNYLKSSFTITEEDPFPKCDNIPTFSRDLTKDEAWYYSSFFPKLNTSAAKITSFRTKCYNCVSWTLGITNDWLWPDGGHLLPTEKSTKLEYFDEFYKNLGYEKVNSVEEADVEAWGIDNGTDPLYMTHASVRYAADRTAWESKLGELERMKHFANDLESDTYGKVRAYYKKTKNVDAQSMFKRQQTPKPTPDILEYDALIRKILSVESKADEFNTLYFQWQTEWFDGAMELSSNPADRKNLPSYKALKNMGSSIIPLIVGRMLLYEDEFIALQLYNDLQKDTKLKISKPKILEGEKSKVNRTLKLYLSSIK